MTANHYIYASIIDPGEIFPIPNQYDVSLSS